MKLSVGCLRFELSPGRQLALFKYWVSSELIDYLKGIFFIMVWILTQDEIHIRLKHLKLGSVLKFYEMYFWQSIHFISTLQGDFILINYNISLYKQANVIIDESWKFNCFVLGYFCTLTLNFSWLQSLGHQVWVLPDFGIPPFQQNFWILAHRVQIFLRTKQSFLIIWEVNLC